MVKRSNRRGVAGDGNICNRLIRLSPSVSDDLLNKLVLCIVKR